MRGSSLRLHSHKHRLDDTALRMQIFSHFRYRDSCSGKEVRHVRSAHCPQHTTAVFLWPVVAASQPFFRASASQYLCSYGQPFLHSCFMCRCGLQLSRWSAFCDIQLPRRPAEDRTAPSLWTPRTTPRTTRCRSLCCCNHNAVSLQPVPAPRAQVMLDRGWCDSSAL